MMWVNTVYVMSFKSSVRLIPAFIEIVIGPIDKAWQHLQLKDVGL